MNDFFRIGFTGDICFSGSFNIKLEKNEEIFPVKLIEKFKNEDFIVCNFEGAAIPKGYQNINNLSVVNSPDSIPYLKARNFNVFNLANNHIFDAGIQGFSNTVEILRDNNISYFGSGNNIKESSSILYLKKSGIKIALIGVCHKEGYISGKCTPGVFCIENFKDFKSVVQEAKKNADFVIINYHGGEEYSLYPMPSRRSLLKKISSLDPDIIICHHPHVFQGIEKVKDTLIFYSLGNFVFDIPHHHNRKYSDETAYLSFTFSSNGFTYKLYPLKIDRDNGILITITDQVFVERINTVSDFRKYYLNWIKEAHRVYEEEKKKRVFVENNRIDRSPEFKFYPFFLTKKIFRVLSSSIRRPLILGVITYRILKLILPVK